MSRVTIVNIVNAFLHGLEKPLILWFYSGDPGTDMRLLTNLED